MRLRSAPLILVALLLTACSAALAPEPPPPTTAAAAPARITSPRLVDPSGFAALAARDEVFVLNVHVPDEGSIPGTDAAVPFDELVARARELPPDKNRPVAVYCRTARMSATAVATLARLGYTDVSELRGGMVAWVADSRPLLPPSS